MIRRVTVTTRDNFDPDATQPIVPVRADVLEPEYPYRESQTETLERVYYLMLEIINVMVNDGAPFPAVAWQLWSAMDAIDLETRRRKGKRP